MGDGGGGRAWGGPGVDGQGSRSEAGQGEGVCDGRVACYCMDMLLDFEDIGGGYY